MTDLRTGTGRRKRWTPVTSWACKRPYWVWWLLFSLSPYHRGYDQGYRQAVLNLGGNPDA